MPADVDLFDMHNQGILTGFTNAQLLEEFAKTNKMMDAVGKYQQTIVNVILERSWRMAEPKQ